MKLLNSIICSRLFIIIFISGVFLTSCSHIKPQKQLTLAQQFQAYTGSAYLIKVRGMVCQACSEGLSKELKKNKQIHYVDIDLVDEIVYVRTLNTEPATKKHILKSLEIRGLDLVSILQK